MLCLKRRKKKTSRQKTQQTENFLFGAVSRDDGSVGYSVLFHPTFVIVITGKNSLSFVLWKHGYVLVWQQEFLK